MLNSVLILYLHWSLQTELVIFRHTVAIRNNLPTMGLHTGKQLFTKCMKNK